MLGKRAKRRGRGASSLGFVRFARVHGGPMLAAGQAARTRRFVVGFRALRAGPMQASDLQAQQELRGPRGAWKCIGARHTSG
jgi:hypothetical protein